MLYSYKHFLFSLISFFFFYLQLPPHLILQCFFTMFYIFSHSVNFNIKASSTPIKPFPLFFFLHKACLYHYVDGMPCTVSVTSSLPIQFLQFIFLPMYHNCTVTDHFKYTFDYSCESIHFIQFLIQDFS